MVKKVLFTVIICFSIFSLVLISMPGESVAKTIVLKFGHGNSPMHPQHKGVVVPWAKKIEEETNGKVKIKFFTGGSLGKVGQTYDTVVKHIVDIGWDVCDYSPGRFPLTTVVELPFMVNSAEKASVALWKTYEKIPAFQKEYEETKLLMLSAHEPGIFASSKKPIDSLEALQGMKMKTASAFTTKAMTLFGAVPVVQPITETYTSLEKGVVDGLAGTFTVMGIFKLHEILKYYTQVDLYSMAFWIAMNKKTYESLPEDVRRVIDKNSGLALSRACGISFEETSAKMKPLCISKGLQEVVLPSGEMEKLKNVTLPVKKEWVKEMEAKGLPGKEVLETITELLK